jgi:hypothetical protein
LIKDGKLGLAYTRNLHDQEDLLQNAMNSLEAGVKADFDFPLTRDLLEMPATKDSANGIGSEELAAESQKSPDERDDENSD